MRHLLYLVAAAMLTVGFSGHATAQEPRQITVTGTGSVTAKPDILRISVGVVAYDDQALRAINEMSAQLENVMAGLSKEGLNPADIQTTGLQLSERYDQNRDNDAPKVSSFIASSSVSIIVRDLDRAGFILDRLVLVGATQISGLQFDIEDRAPLVERARIAAIGDAIAKTTLYAQAAKVTTGAIVSISETAQGSGFQQDQMMAMAEARSIPIAAGMLDVTAQITVVTAIE